MFRAILFAGCAAVCAAGACADEKKPDPLTQTVMGLDRALFDAYNACDLAKLSTMVAEDLEFYHDQAGLMRGRGPFVEAIKANICGKVRREIVVASAEVFPLKEYGAVQIGIHKFCPIDANGACKVAGAPAKFVHLWHEKDGSWTLARVISYDHR